MSVNYQENIPLPVSDVKLQEVFSKAMTQVYLWMAIGLMVTAVVSVVVVSSPFLLGLIFSSRIVFYGLLILAGCRRSQDRRIWTLITADKR